MQQRIAETVAEAGHESNGWILVVDDDDFSRDLLVRRLHRAGYGTAACADGRQALALLDRHPFSLVLLDVVMPGIGGQELLTSIRERFGPPGLPVIMVTSQTESHVISDCFRRGASDYVTKPFDTHALLARIEVQLARHRAEAALKQWQDDLERHVERRTAELQRANSELTNAQNMLVEALDAMSDGFAVWDSMDRLVVCNRAYRESFGRNAEHVRLGAEFEALLRLQVENRDVRTSVGRSQEWLAQRLARHRMPAGPFEEEMSDGRWLRISETRTENAVTVGLCTDITEMKRREIALKTFAESNRRLAAAVNAASNGIIITDPTRHGNPTVFANPAFTAMTGWPVEEALGRDRRMLVGPGTDMEEAERLDRSMLAGTATNAELKLYTRDGQPFWAEVNVSPMRDSKGKVVNWVIVQTNITARKETTD